METSVLHQDQATERRTVIQGQATWQREGGQEQSQTRWVGGRLGGRFQITEAKGKWLLFLWIPTIECKFAETFKEEATPGWEGSLGEKSYMYMYG